MMVTYATLWKKVLPIAAGVVTSSCSPSPQTDYLEKSLLAINEFHKMYNAGNFDGIEKGADPELIAKRGFSDFLQTKKEQYGGYIHGKVVGSSIAMNYPRKYITITMKSKFQKGEFFEQFTYLLRDENGLYLYRYSAITNI